MMKFYKNGSVKTTVNSAIHSPTIGNSPNRSQSQTNTLKIDKSNSNHQSQKFSNFYNEYQMHNPQQN